MYDKSKKYKFRMLGEDSTKYGEFVPTKFTWMSSEKQKEIARHLEYVSDLNESSDENADDRKTEENND